MKGLYKNVNGQLMSAANAIHYPDETVITVKDHIDKPEQTEIHDGWHLFHSRQAALDFFGLCDEIPDAIISLPPGSNS